MKAIFLPTGHSRINQLILLAAITLCPLLSNSCSTSKSNYNEVSYGGSLYYYDHYGSYYRRYWYGYRPCPKPPGKPDHPHKPEHPIVKPGKPDRPSIQPVNRRPHTRPSTPTYRPAPRPMPRPRPSVRAR